MRQAPLAWIGFLLLVAPAAAAADDAGPFQYGNVVYRLPDDGNWVRGRTTPKWVVLLNRPGKGFAYIYLTRGGPWADAPSLEAWTTAAMARFNDDRNADAALDGDRKVVVSDACKAVAVRSTPAVLDTQVLRPAKGRSRSARLGLAVRAKDRAELLVFEAADADSLKRYVAAFTRFAGSIHLVNLGASPVVGPPVPGPLDGIFTTTSVGYGVNGFQSDTRFLILDRSGRFRDGLPTDGPLRHPDLAAAADASPDAAGVYRVDAGTFHLDYADGHRDARPFAPDGNGFRFAADVYAPVPVPPDGTALAGTYTSLHYAAFAPGTGLTGGITSSRSYTFAADGRWSLDGFAGVSADTNNGAGDTTGGFTVGSKSNRAGTYAVRDGLVTFTAADGTVARKTLIVMADDRVMIVLGGQTYLAQGKPTRR